MKTNIKPWISMKFHERNIFSQKWSEFEFPLCRKKKTFPGFINCRLLLNVSSRTCRRKYIKHLMKWIFYDSRCKRNIERMEFKKQTNAKWRNAGSTFPKGSRFWWFSISRLMKLACLFLSVFSIRVYTELLIIKDEDLLFLYGNFLWCTNHQYYQVKVPKFRCTLPIWNLNTFKMKFIGTSLLAPGT